MSSAACCNAVHQELNAGNADVIGSIRTERHRSRDCGPGGGAVMETVGGVVSAGGVPPMAVFMSV